VALEMASFQVTELGDVIEGYVVDRTNLLSDGIIEVNNLPVGARMDGCKIGGNVVIVFFKFSFTMWENELCCLEDSSPSDNPIPMGLNGFGGFGSAKMQLEVTDVLDCPIVHTSGVHA
jgi:hypothetical protein